MTTGITLIAEQRFTHIWRCRRLCQTALSSGLGARRIRTLLRGLPWGLQPPLCTTSRSPFSLLPFGVIETWSRNSVGLLRTVKQASAMLDSRRGSSVTKSTRSRETRANTRRSVSRRAQEGCRRRPSTFARAPPKSLGNFSLNLHWYKNLKRINYIENTKNIKIWLK